MRAQTRYKALRVASNRSSQERPTILDNLLSTSGGPDCFKRSSMKIDKNRSSKNLQSTTMSSRKEKSDTDDMFSTLDRESAIQAGRE